MPEYSAPIRDYRFVAEDILPLAEHAAVAGVGDIPTDLRDPIWDEAAKFSQEVLFPLNQSGDAQGCTFNDGEVKCPDGFKEAYAQYVQAGWASLTADPAYGGQGLPEWLNMPMLEMVCSANLSFGLTPGLSHGFYNALHLHGSDELKQTYLPKITTGEWSGVMCLTEAHCGTDLGLIRTTAKPADDGSFVLDGNKIFITSGEHDMSENILHLVLAKLPDAPAGVKGISLFMVPKFLVNEDGSVGERNAVACGSIEHKMGINASPTCVINFDAAKGWLVGEPHKGLRAMFTMMNAARLYVGVQGLGIAEVAYQNALIYAKDRLQGRGLKGAVQPDKPADPLTVHPDVKRMLLMQKSFCEGARMLAMETALSIDLSHNHEDKKIRKECDDFVALMTPVVKSYFTDMGFEMSVLAQQIYGGHGYIKEYGMEQFVRDARIAQIYEGANGIQALDLVGRKLAKDFGALLRTVFHPMEAFIAKHEGNAQMKPFVKPLKKHMEYLQQASLWIAQNGLADPNNAAAASSDYLRMFGVVYIGFLWARAAEASLQKLAAGTDDAAFYQEKLETAGFYMAKMLPPTVGHLTTIITGFKPLDAEFLK